MICSWLKMTPDNFAAFQRLMGGKVIELDHVYWVQVRPGFYRPLLHFEAYRSGAITLPSPWFGGGQFAVAPEEPANSCLNRLVFENAPDYSLDRLEKNPRRQVKRAGNEFVIRPMHEVEEFKRQAFPVYASFYQRTRYSVAAQRREPVHFSRWAEALFKIPGVLVLGGYREGELGGVSLSFVVHQTLIYATFFCNDASLRLHLSDLMLHTVRASAASSPEIKEIFVSMHKGGGGLDDFYRHRGAKLVRQRAWLQLNPITRLLLRSCRPRQYALLLGRYDPEIWV